jgi:SAM-dependent methyltransferase
MPHDGLDFRLRSSLTEILDEPCCRDTLRAYLRDLARVNRWTLAYRPTLHWLDELLPALKNLSGPVRILDVGCGYGDGLRRIGQWATARGIVTELIGLDRSADAIAIAAEVTSASRIQWICADVFSYHPSRPVHFVVSSLFAHHLADGDVARFIAWMEAYAELGWFINDLSRAPVPYHLFRVFSKLFRLHPYVQNDGPISIARSFVPEDWRTMCAAAGLNNGAVEISPFKPSRLCVSRRKLS